MKVKTSLFAALLSTVLIQQSADLRAGQPAIAPGAETRAGQSATVESAVPREGLRFYIEMTGAALGEIVRGKNGPAVGKMFAAGPLKVTTPEMAALVMSNTGALSNSRLALVGYGSGGMAAAIEAANSADAQQLAAGAAKLLAVDGPSRSAAPKEIDVTVRGRMVFAGERATVARLAQPSGERSLADDQEFMKARAHFSEDAVFAFVELGSAGLLSPPSASGAMDAAQTAGMLAAMSGMPYAIALGGSFEGDVATVRALLINGSKQSAGAFSSLLGGLFSSAKSAAGFGQPMAASFASPSADVFVDLMIDWDKLLDAIQSMFGMFAGAVAGANGAQSAGGLQAGQAQNADFLAMVEASLGFSFKHDLIPTLGNELAITLSDFNNISMPAASGGQTTNGSMKKSSPRFMLMVAVRDEAKFEKLLVKLLSGPRGSAAQPFVRTPYRGATISSSKDFAYTITGGFLLAGGSVAEIRRAIDAHATGNALASTPEFRQAIGSSRQATLQAYISSRLSRELFESLSKEMARSEGTPYARLDPASATASAIGFSMTGSDDGLMIEAHLPANLALLALGSMLNAKPAPYGISSSPAGAPDSGSRRTNGRATPRLTDDDLRLRRP